MAKLSTLQDKTPQSVIIFGEPKSGKTKLAGDLSRLFNLHWFDLENGKSTLFKLPPEQQERIEVYDIPDTKSFPVAIETLLKVFTVNKPHVICNAHGKVNCAVCNKAQKETGEELTTPFDISKLDVNKDIIVIDSLTQASASAMSFITKGQPDSYKIEWDDYSRQGVLLDKILSSIQQGKYNIVVLTHVTETKLEDKKLKLVPLAGTRNFSRNVAKYFDHVVYLEVKNKKHVAGSATDYSANAITGSRLEIDLSNGDLLEDIFLGKVKNKPKATDTAKTSAQRLEAAKAKLNKK